MPVDWNTEPELDPRLPTDSNYVEATALSEKYPIAPDEIMKLVSQNPNLARSSSGNPWVDSPTPEKLYVHEPSIEAYLQAR